MNIFNRYTETNETILDILAKGLKQGFSLDNFLNETF